MNVPKQVTEALHPVNSECDETEGDGDSVWSTTSIGGTGSEGGTDNSSSLDSALQNLPTVRANKDEEDDEIQKLILAAEALRIERTRLRISSPASSMDHKSYVIHGAERTNNTASEHHKETFGNHKGGVGTSGHYIDTENRGQRFSNSLCGAEGTTTTNNTASEHHKETLGNNKGSVGNSGYYTDAENRGHRSNSLYGAEGTTSTTNTASAQLKETFGSPKGGSGNSGYFTDTDNNGQTSYSTSSFSEQSINISVHGERDHKSVESRETLTGTPYDSLSKVSNTSYDHQGMDSIRPDNPPIPRLSLEVNRDGDSGRTIGVSEERVPLHKIEKEVCNSSIRGLSASGVREGQHQVKDSAGRQSLGPSLLVEDMESASVLVHEEGSCLLTLALTATSNLRRLTRLLRQVGTLQLGPETPRVVESVLHELGQHETQQQALETKLTTAAAKLQTAVAQVRGLEAQWQEHQRQGEGMHQMGLSLLQQVEKGLETCGLTHMLAVTSPRRRCPQRVLEDVGSAVALLMGELSRRIDRSVRGEEEASCLREELQNVRQYLTQHEARSRQSEAEARQMKEQSHEDITSLRQCLAHAESNLTDTKLENARLREEVKRQGSESSATVATLQKKLCEAQHKTETRVSELERELHLNTKEKEQLEASVKELKDQLLLRTQQVHLVEEENSQLIESLRSALRQQQAEVEQLRQNLESANAEKSHLAKSNDEIKQELAAKDEELAETRGKCEQLKKQVTDLEEEQMTTRKDWQQKVESVSSERNELAGKARAQEFAILQLRTELEMERLQTRALTEEASAQGKKARDLQEQLWTQSRKFRNSTSSLENINYHDQQGTSGSLCRNCNTLTQLPETPPQSSHKMEMVDEASVVREEKLHSLLREKDVELRSLHHNFSSQISSKNQELEVLTTKLIGLEEQLCTLVKGLEASATIGNITTEVGHLLQERTQHLDSLHQSSRWLQEELSSLAMENHTLSKELNVARRVEKDSLEEAQDSARKARQEAREERVATARLREDCSRLQAQLDQVQYTLQQERQERRISAMVNGAKHNEFSSLLDNATAALNHYQT